MTIIYKTIPKINPREPQVAAKHYASAVPQSKTDIKKISKAISERTSLDHVDTQAVILATVDMVIAELQEGRSVQLGNPGSFAISLSSEGAVTADKFTPSAIKKARIIYRPGSEIKDMLKTLKYEKEA